MRVLRRKTQSFDKDRRRGRVLVDRWIENVVRCEGDVTELCASKLHEVEIVHEDSELRAMCRRSSNVLQKCASLFKSARSQGYGEVLL